VYRSIPLRLRLTAAAILAALGWLAPLAAAQPSLPNLFVDATALADSLVRRTQRFKSSSCAVQEACVDGTGKRTLLRFDTLIVNDGAADLVLGAPGSNPTLFEFSPCHGHYHLASFADYELVTLDGLQVVRGHKQAFCLLDSIKLDPLAGPRTYSCGFQGISAGWADLYSSSLDCQWIDVTGVVPGDYLLRVRVDPLDLFAESDETDNVTEVPVTINRRGRGRRR